MAQERTNGFPRAERLLKSTEFRRTTRRGQPVRCRHFKVFVLPRRAGRRLGLTVSRKVGNSVERNRVKRRIREYYRLHKDQLPRADIVVIAHPGAADLDSRSVAQQLARALIRNKGDSIPKARR